MRRLLAACFIVTALAACDSPESRLAKSRALLESYQTAPDDAKQAAVARSLDELDAAVAKLRDKGDSRAAGLADQARVLRSDFQAAKLARALQDARRAVESVGETFKNTYKSIENAFRPSPSPENR